MSRRGRLGLTRSGPLLMIRLAIRVNLSGGFLGTRWVTVGAFGERLRREREMRGISLEEIVATTKIGTRLLRALENEQFDLLPGGIFNKSYVRAYAKCVGIDEDEAVAAYLEAANEVPPDARVIAHQASFHSERSRDRRGFPIVPVLILLVVIAGGVGGWKAYQDRQRDRDVHPATGTWEMQVHQRPLPSQSAARALRRRAQPHRDRHRRVPLPRRRSQLSLPAKLRRHRYRVSRRRLYRMRPLAPPQPTQPREHGSK